MPSAAEGAGDILDLLLALLRILIHRENTQDDVLVLDVGGTHQLLESFPVLSGVLRVEGGGGVGLLHLLLHVLGGSFLTLASQTLVEVVATIRRCIGRDLDAVETQAFLVLGNLAQQADELLDGVVLKLGATELSLVDEELHVGILLLVDDALEGIEGHSGLGRGERALVELACGDHTVGHLHIGNLDGFLAYLSVEGEEELALLHLRLIGEV